MKKWIATGAVALAIVLPTTDANASTHHTVQDGESLWKISQQYGTTVNQLIDANGLSHSTIYPGQTIVIPGNQHYTVQDGDSLWTISQAHGMTVNQLKELNGIWTNEIYPGQTITVYAQGNSAPATTASQNEEELELLSRLVHSEARGEPYKGKVAVAAVVLNRIESGEFPNSVEGVIYETHGNGNIYAFEPVQNGEINRHADEESIRAAQEALNGYDPSNGALYFFNPETSTSDWINRLTVDSQIGKHVFASN
ncbi:LysM peptidoglycan-binding domain-containing protein [Alteribacter populi]|uniref:LysM peptidoglycan-binding domain-containing protein n=1 Tax=Alteribacter populi TaxID=2011011 RepID=UPI000BBAB57E|nr:LysM peptidoglycan-binding domain-containing protein [Alteribacter populi]